MTKRLDLSRQGASLRASVRDELAWTRKEGGGDPMTKFGKRLIQAAKEANAIAHTLGTLDLKEKPGQKITWFHHVKHNQEDMYVVPVPGDEVFSAGPHHGYYAYTVASSRKPGATDDDDSFSG